MNKFYAGLLKFGKKEHMEALFNDGEIYLNTFDYFRKIDISPDGRGDPNEYLTSHYAGKGLDSMKFTISANINGEDFEINPSRQSGLLSIDIRCETPKYTHLFCMTRFDMEWTIQTGKLLDEKNVAEGKDWVVAFKDPLAFLKKLKSYLDSQGFQNCANRIEYVDPNEHCGEMGCFKKYNQYSYQNEFRIAVSIPNTHEAKIIKIGSLADIALPPMLARDFLNSKFELIQRDNK